MGKEPGLADTIALHRGLLWTSLGYAVPIIASENGYNSDYQENRVFKFNFPKYLEAILPVRVN